MEITFENSKVIVGESVANTGISPGEIYVAKRNVGWKLLTCREFNAFNSIVHPVEFPEYSYDSWECFKVIEIH